MLFQNRFMVLKKLFAVAVALNLVLPAPAYSAREVATAKSPVLNGLESDMLATGMSDVLRSEMRRDIRTGFQHNEKFYTNSIGIYNISGLLKNPFDQIPDEIVNKIRETLSTFVKGGWLKSGLVNDIAGTHFVVHVTHNQGELNASVHRLMLDAIREALLDLEDQGRLNTDIKSLSYEELTKRLNVIANDDSKVERDAESVSIAVGVGVGIGAANIKLFREFAIPGSTPLQKLGAAKSPGFRFRVKKTADILAGNYEGAEEEYEISMAQMQKSVAAYAPDDEKFERPLFMGTIAEALMQNPGIFVDPAIKLFDIEKGLDKKKQVPANVGESIYEAIWLLAKVSQPNDYQITAVYPTEGGSLPTGEPIATVVYQPVFGSQGQAAMNPVIIYRSQSGGDAVGGIGNMIGGVNFVPGGPNSDYYVATYPATMKEARKAPDWKKGLGFFANYGYQSRKNGEIPREGVLDHVGMHNFGYFAQRELAENMGLFMSSHDHDQPFLSPGASERLVEHVRKEQNRLFRSAPKESEEDAFLSDVNRKIESGELNIVTDDKADMGGQWGHTKVPEMFIAIYRATLMEAEEQGLISYGNTIGFSGKHTKVKDSENVGVGDDGHLLMLGDRSRNGKEAHQLSFLAFTRTYLFADKLGKKYYGIGQDFAGPEAKAAKANPFFYAKLSDRFFELLEQVMPEIEKEERSIEIMKEQWAKWQSGGEKEQQLSEPFSGNVSQQGIGSARYAFDSKTEKGFDMIAGDKMGPAALNRIIREGVYAALAAGKFSNGLVFEIWDLKAFDENGKIPADDFPKKAIDVQMLVEQAAKAGRISRDDLNWTMQSAYHEGVLDKLDAAGTARLEEILRKSGFVPTKRIFLDAGKDKDEIIRYLADSDRFNVKHVWGKKSEGWDIEHPEKYLDRPFLGASVTRLGILSGGEYLGKDDPVMVGHSELMHFLHEYLRKNPLIVQGDMNGSHWEAAMVSGMKHAVATARSFPILVGLRYTVSKDGKRLQRVKDIYGDKSFDTIRKKTSRFNMWFDTAQMSQFEPHATNFRTVEAAYDLAKILRWLNQPDNPFIIANKRKQEKFKKRFFADPASNYLNKLYQTVGTDAAAVRSEVRSISTEVTAVETLLRSKTRETVITYLFTNETDDSVLAASVDSIVTALEKTAELVAAENRDIVRRAFAIALIFSAGQTVSETDKRPYLAGVAEMIEAINFDSMKGQPEKLKAYAAAVWLNGVKQTAYRSSKTEELRKDFQGLDVFESAIEGVIQPLTSPDVIQAMNKPILVSASRRSEVRLDAKPNSKLAESAAAQLSSVRLPAANFGTGTSALRVVSGKINEALVVDSAFALEEGGLALLPTLSGKNPSVVIVSNEKEAVFVRQFNETQKLSTPVLIAYDADEAVALLRKQIGDQIAALGGTRLGSSQLRALVSDPTSVTAVALKKQLGAPLVTNVTPGMFSRLATNTGLAGFVDQMRDAFSAFTQSA